MSRLLNEPIGAEAAIYWNMVEGDRHSMQETMADAIGDYPECVSYHEGMRKAHAQRLMELTTQFPETAKTCRIRYNLASEVEGDL